MEIEKKSRKTPAKVNSMGAAKSEAKENFLGRHLIEYLVTTLGFSKAAELAQILDVNDRSLRNWAAIPYDELNKNNLKLKTLFLAVNKMEKENIPASAILKLISGRLLPKTGSPTLIQILNEDPANRLIDFTVESLIKNFKEKIFVKTSAAEINELKERFQLTDEQKRDLLKKIKR